MHPRLCSCSLPFPLSPHVSSLPHTPSHTRSHRLPRRALAQFFLVFYGGQCYTRFFVMYGHCVGIAGCVMCWVALIKLHLADSANVRWNAVRFVLAAAHINYYSLSGGALTVEEWAVVQGRDLLTADEEHTIKSYGGFKPFLPIYWALCEVRAQLVIQMTRSKESKARDMAREVAARDYAWMDRAAAHSAAVSHAPAAPPAATNKPAASASPAASALDEYGDDDDDDDDAADGAVPPPAAAPAKMMQWVKQRDGSLKMEEMDLPPQQAAHQQPRPRKPKKPPSPRKQPQPQPATASAASTGPPPPAAAAAPPPPMPQRPSFDADADVARAGMTHPVFIAFEWDEFCRIAFELRGHCSQIVNLLKQPVPWAYFHLLNLMCFVVLFLLGYGLVGMAEWPVTVVVHAIVSLIFMGLKELSVAMADPFGEDTIDFALEKYLGTIYSNAISQLSDSFEPMGHELPDGIGNPLPEHTGGVGDRASRGGGGGGGAATGGGVHAGCRSQGAVAGSSQRPMTKMPTCSDALAKATTRGALLAESAGVPRATTFWVGARVEHPVRGVGTVTGHLEDGRTLVKFDSGERHRYKHGSMSKFKSHALAPDAVSLAESSAAGAAGVAPKSPSVRSPTSTRSVGDGDEGGGLRRGSSFVQGSSLTLSAGV